ncbi:MAG: HIT family protein [Acidimicrobiia bacterium]
MPTIFSRIVSGEIPAYKVYEDDRHLAFLDIQPIQPGHTLVIPKQEIDYLFDLDGEAYGDLWRVVWSVEAGIKRATGCRRVCLIVAGWEVPHAHVHLIPTNQLEHLPFPPRTEQPPEDMEEMAASIRKELNGG